jgi:prepilin-type processing-associated H-X9-DG protein
MRITRSYSRNQGITLTETVVVVSVLVVLAAVLLSLPDDRGRKARKISCVNNLKQVGLAFRIWEGDNNDEYPMAISITNGGAMEAVLGGNPVQVFQVMSNELSTPTILFCRADTYRDWPTNFGPGLTAKNVSYFVNADATKANPQDFMCGDDNFEIGRVPINSGLTVISSNTPIAWSAERHKLSGNILFADGSVGGRSNAGLKSWQRSTNFTNVRLAIP